MTTIQPRAAYPDIEQLASATVIATLTTDVLTLMVSGEVDKATRLALYDALYDAITTHTAQRVVMDLSSLGFSDIAGARVIANAYRLAVARGSVCQIREPQPHIAWLLQFTVAAGAVLTFES